MLGRGIGHISPSAGFHETTKSHTSTIMASGLAKFARYKLNTVFDGDSVVHTTYKSDLRTRQRKVEVKTRWRREEEMGSGAFGVVWRESAGEESGELRAVKIIPKRLLNLPEVDALVEVQDVGSSIVSLVPSSRY